MTGAEPRIQVHGHRGARAVMPENTLPAFTYALDAGVDVLELDMAVTADDVVVVSHDPSMNAKFCSGPAGAETAIRKMTFAQLRQWDCGARANPDYPKQKAVPGTRVPRLEDVFQLALRKKREVQFNIETKINPAHPDLAPAPEKFVSLVLAVVRKFHLEDRVILQSFDFRTLHAMKKLEPRIRLAALFPETAADTRTDFVAVAKEGGAPIISPNFLLVTPERVAAAHKAGLTVVAWTANRPEAWDVLIAAKVDAIISDDPAPLIAHLKSKGLR